MLLFHRLALRPEPGRSRRLVAEIPARGFPRTLAAPVDESVRPVRAARAVAADHAHHASTRPLVPRMTELASGSGGHVHEAHSARCLRDLASLLASHRITFLSEALREAT